MANTKKAVRRAETALTQFLEALKQEERREHLFRQIEEMSARRWRRWEERRRPSAN
jgi:hypothetical protein